MSDTPIKRKGAVNAFLDLPLDPPGDDVRFADRRDAGRRLAALLGRFREEHPVVVGIPRGGVPVAAEVATALSAPLEVTVVRKIGAPGNPEYGIGALAEGDVVVIDEHAVRALGISASELALLRDRASKELAERLRRYRGAAPPLSLEGRVVLLVDDGLATGRSVRAAAESLRRRGASRVVLAVPVAAPSSLAELRDCIDEAFCVEAPADMWAIGFWYHDFRPTADSEVASLIAEHSRGGPVRRARSQEVAIEAGPHTVLAADLVLPPSARAVIAFAHGSGSSRLSPRNRSVARALNQAGFGTLLLDLLTPVEEIARDKVFDIWLLGERLLAATGWLAEEPDTRGLPLGYLGASTGAAAALIAAAEAGPRVGAVVSRGGRPDLATPRLADVRAPTLLIVGALDEQVLELNREAQALLACENRLVVIPGATHLFEEPGALEEVCRQAVDWFRRHLLTEDTSSSSSLETASAGGG